MEEFHKLVRSLELKVARQRAALEASESLLRATVVLAGTVQRERLEAAKPKA